MKKIIKKNNFHVESFSKKEERFLLSLNTPAKVQDFLNTLKFNFEINGETLQSPISTLRSREAHCFEGALLGAHILSLHGFPPLVLHLKTAPGDYDHVIAPFQVDGFWGALSKTNHAVLRYREPIYKNIRELCMSYFHEYFLDDGRKTLRQYSMPLNLNKLTLKYKNWFLDSGNVWYLDKALDRVKHFEILPKKYIKKLRKADKVEIEAGKILDHKKI
jgi:hypothetical protein